MTKYWRLSLSGSRYCYLLFGTLIAMLPLIVTLQTQFKSCNLEAEIDRRAYIYHIFFQFTFCYHSKNKFPTIEMGMNE